MRHSKLLAALVAVLAVSATAWPSGQERPAVTQAPQQPAVGTGFISGQVIDVPSGRPIAEATVFPSGRASALMAVGLAAPTGRAGAPGPALLPVLTDEQGRFFFANLPAGTYTFTTQKTGYVVPRAAAPASIEIGDGERVNDVKLRLAKVASISGTLRDEAGDPVVGTDVLVIRRGVTNGRPTLQPAGLRSRSDDRGAYRVGNLQPGEYIVCACSRDIIPIDGGLLTTLGSEPLQLMNVAARALSVGSDVVSLDSTLKTFGPTFHPNSVTASRSTRVTLAPGEDKTAIDINMDLVRMARISGRVIGATSPVQAGTMRLVPSADGEALVDLFSLPPMLVQADGRFDFAAVPPGQYRLVVIHFDTGVAGGGPSGAAMGFVGARGASPPAPPSGATMSAAGPVGQAENPPLWANEPITVGENGVTGLVVTLNRSPKVAGRMQWIGAAPQPPAQMLQRLTVLMQPAAVNPLGSAIAQGRFAQDASFLVNGVIPGKYIINAAGSVPGYPTLKSVTIGGQDITDMPLEVAEKDLSEVVITYVDTPLSTLTVTTNPLPGTANPFDDTFAVVFPIDRKYWAEPGAARRRIRLLPFSSKGIATNGELPAGDYFVAVLTGLESVDWMDPVKFELFSRKAQRVTIADGGKANIEVRR